MLSLWSYIRQRAKEAFLAGCNDALVELDGAGADGMADATAQLKSRLTLALPAPPEEESTSGRKRVATKA